MLSYLCAIGFDVQNMLTAENLSLGLYGIGIASVGMLSHSGNHPRNRCIRPHSRQRRRQRPDERARPRGAPPYDILDALGNTTAATGKGFAIGSAALTALALLASYLEEIKIALGRVENR